MTGQATGTVSDQLEGQPEQLTGAQSLVRALEHAGVEVIFGIPGGAILPAYDPLFDSEKIRHILVRHEQGAGHAAQGYAMVTGRVGVCMATSGPGATNLVTALADAHMDSVPIVAITGQVPSAAIGTDAFQEADIRGITMPITKHSYLLTDPDDIPRTIAEAFHIASTGRPGPVLVDIAKDALQKLDHVHVAVRARAAGLPPDHPAARQAGARGGPPHRRGQAPRPVRRRRRHQGQRVGRARHARRADPDPRHHDADGPRRVPRLPRAAPRHARHARVGRGRRRRCRSPTCSSASARASTTGSPASSPRSRRGAKVIHADIDPAEISKNRVADVPIVGDCREVISDLIVMLRKQADEDDLVGDYTAWREQMLGVKAKFPVGYDEPEEGLAPQKVIERIGQISGPEATYVAGVGQHQMWAAHYIPFERPRQWLNSGGAGTMGYCVPAAMGAQVGEPDNVIWAIDGDGCFQMTNQELATCAIEGIPIKVAIINNSSLGMVRQWQTLFYDSRYSNTDLNTVGEDSGARRIPDFVKLAEAYGCVGLRCESPDDLDETIQKALSITDVPVVIDFVVERDAMVWPMVAAGTSNDDIKIARDLAPEWDQDEL